MNENINILINAVRVRSEATQKLGFDPFDNNAYTEHLMKHYADIFNIANGLEVSAGRTGYDISSNDYKNGEIKNPKQDSGFSDFNITPSKDGLPN